MNKTLTDIIELRDMLRKEGKNPEEFFPSCRGCGYCCHQATCSLGVSLFGAIHPCPALIWDGEKYRCKLANDFEDALYIGSGCCSPLNSWRKEKRW
jgi:hypothetical protein